MTGFLSASAVFLLMAVVAVALADATGASSSPAQLRASIDLTSAAGVAWRVKQADRRCTLCSGPVAASVPGQIHLDLWRAGVIDDPYASDNDVKQHWVALANWTYTTAAPVVLTADELRRLNRATLVLDGVDTKAEIAWNGRRVGSTRNQFVQYRFDVTAGVRKANTLSVAFTSAIWAAQAAQDTFVAGFPHTNGTDGSQGRVPPNCPPDVQHGFCHVNFLRKSPKDFSWDWGPAFAPQGIWRPLRLELSYRTEAEHKDGGDAVANAGVEPQLSVEALVVTATPVTRLQNRPLVWDGQLRASESSFDLSGAWHVNVRMHLRSATAAAIRATATLELLGGASSDELVRHAWSTETGTTAAAVAGDGMRVVPGAQDVDLPVTSVKSPTLWWPNGYGEPRLYRLCVDVTTTTMVAEAGNEPASARLCKRVGFRTIELLRPPVQAPSTKAAAGHAMLFFVNNVGVFIQGANFIPVDAFEGRVDSTVPTSSPTQDRNDTRSIAPNRVLPWLFASALAANMNTLRNWGGGIYQSDAFYDLADESGILIWEEFMFACALYPNDAAFLDSVAVEVRQQTRRLQHHASILLWGGNNENEAAVRDNWYGLPQPRDAIYDRMYSELYFDTIRANITDRVALNSVSVAAAGGARAYIPSSPGNGNETRRRPIDNNPGSELEGDVHYYNYAQDCWQLDGYPIPRFASEYGVQSWPSLQSLADAWPGIDGPTANLTWQGPFLMHRQHHDLGQQQIMWQLERHWRVPDRRGVAGARSSSASSSSSSSPLLLHQHQHQHQLDDKAYLKRLLYLVQLMQGECIRRETEHYRRHRSSLRSDGRGLTAGTLYWQLNDIWQGASWAGIEYSGRWKALHYAMVRTYAPVLISARLAGNEASFDRTLSIDIVKDRATAAPLTGTLLVKIRHWDDDASTATTKAARTRTRRTGTRGNSLVVVPVKVRLGAASGSYPATQQPIDLSAQLRQFCSSTTSSSSSGGANKAVSARCFVTVQWDGAPSTADDATMTGGAGSGVDVDMAPQLLWLTSPANSTTVLRDPRFALESVTGETCESARQLFASNTATTTSFVHGALPVECRRMPSSSSAAAAAASVSPPPVLFRVTLSSQAFAPYTWLETVLSGRFSANAFLAEPGRHVVVFVARDGTTTAAKLKASLDVWALNSLYSISSNTTSTAKATTVAAAA